MKIGIMDSGIGGLTVLKECLLMQPEHEYFYYADSINAPYGIKTVDQVYNLVESAVKFLIDKGCEIIVLACNTATSAAAAQLRQDYNLPIIGMEPAIKPALAAANGKRVLVTATKHTLTQPKFLELINAFDVNGQVDFVPLTELVAFGEAGTFDQGIVVAYLNEALAGFDLNHYGSIVLGCTHFPLFRDSFEQIFPSRTAIIDGAVGTAKRVFEFACKTSENPGLTFYLSGEVLNGGELFDRMMHIINV